MWHFFKTVLHFLKYIYKYSAIDYRVCINLGILFTTFAFAIFPPLFREKITQLSTLKISTLKSFIINLQITTLLK